MSAVTHCADGGGVGEVAAVMEGVAVAGVALTAVAAAMAGYGASVATLAGRPDAGGSNPNPEPAQPQP